MSAAVKLDPPEQEVTLSPEHQVIFDYLREIRDDLKKVGEKLENHLGYHAGVKELTEQKTTWVRDLTSLLKDRPWITVGIVIVVVALGSDNAIDVKSYFEAWRNAQ
jgi:ElaB/YqjD/DUF883 family membrane-anchored ribosome-binding protein